jgi:hypothetical protein
MSNRMCAVLDGILFRDIYLWNLIGSGFYGVFVSVTFDISSQSCSCTPQHPVGIE